MWDLLRTTWPFLLLGASFASISAWLIAAAAIRNFGGAKDVPWDRIEVLGALVIAGVFGPVALLLLAFVWLIGRERSVERHLQAEYPRQPWRHRLDWANQRSHHVLTPRALAFLGLATSGNALTIGGLSLFLLRPPALEGAAERAGVCLVFAGFLVVTLTGGVYALWMARDAIRLRQVNCALIAPPFQPGGSVRCVIHWENAPPPGVPLLVSLACTSTCTTRPRLLGKEVGERETYYRSEFHARFIWDHLPRGGHSGSLPLRFALPVSVPETSDQESTTWDLTLQWRSAAELMHTVEFELPVFRNNVPWANSSDAEKFDSIHGIDPTSGFLKDVRRESLAELLESFRGRLDEQSPRGWSICVPRANTPGLLKSVTFLGASLSFMGGGLAFGGFAGAAFGALPWIVTLPMAGYQRLWCGDGRIEYDRVTFLGRRKTSVDFADIRQIEHRQVDRSREGMGVHQVTAHLVSGESVTVLSNALSPLVAAAIAQRLNESRSGAHSQYSPPCYCVAFLSHETSS